MALNYSIGTENFLELVGAPDLLKRLIQVVERPGIDGAAFWDAGQRGAAFQIRSRVDQATMNGCFDAFARYAAMVGAVAPVNMAFASVSLANYKVKFRVLDVKIASVTALAGGLGGLNPPSMAWLECDWTLKPVSA